MKDRYSRYRIVNQRWLGSVPEHWSTTRLRYVCEISTGSGDTVNAEPDGDYPFIVRSPNALRAANFDNEGDSILTVGDGAVGEVFHHIRAGRFLAHQRVYVLKDFKRVESRFLFYYFSSHFRLMAQDGSARTTVDSVRRWMLTDMPVVVPPQPEQRAIAGYLDRETARIDTLIEEQQRLIELLRERRQDLIRAAVLGTENPFAPTAGAVFTAIGHHFSVTLGKMLDAGKAVRADDQMLPYIRAGNIQDAGLELEDVNEMPYSAAESANLNLLAGDLLVVEGGAVGTNVVIRQDMPGWSFQKTVNRLRPTDGWSAAWLGYLLRTYRDIGVIDIVCNKSTIPHLTAEKLRSMRVPSVPPAEQLRVVAMLDQETAKVDSLTAEAERFIELSKERRSALITAAVTGQIDVRDGGNGDG